MGNDLKSLNIEHKDFIDVVAMLPHHNPLPQKHKLKDLAAKYLNMYIQIGLQNPEE